MKCNSCGGRLEGAMTFCPFCGVRQDVNLRQIHFRDLGTDAALPCPECTTPLAVVEFETEPKIRIERCATCFGAFFNPGELEALLDAQTNPLVWIDPVQLQQIAKDFGYTHEVVYRKCPMCAERMSHLNFGGQSGVILDRCGTHGVWLEGSELRRLTEWWRAGGKHLHQENEAAKAKKFYSAPGRGPARVPMTGTTEPLDDSKWEKVNNGFTIACVVGSIAAVFLD
ncbi:zf-TFIIB domain-containing protein [Luteolibacter sp. Populi]|uniref:zf-TFIIB domain-containing protein n=1 Tax=Luteolibacter sp. Populi TaxID=3230487 RepID=UPI0034667A35